MVVTPVDYWTARLPDRWRWATATEAMMCAYQRLDGVCNAGSVIPAIEAGDRYFDTGDRVDAAAPVPLVICEGCARAEIPDAAFDLH